MNTLLDMGKVQARLLLAFSMILLAGITIIIISSLDDDNMKIVLLDYKASYYPFTIQTIMWVFFFLGIGELLYRYIQAQFTLNTLKRKMLPDGENEILTKIETREIYRKIKNKAHFPDDLPSILKKLILHFQGTDSIAQTQELFNSQMDLKYNKKWS